MHILYWCHKGGKMNRKLKKYANKQLKRYRDEDFLNELKSKQKEMKKNNDRKKFIPICLSTSSALVMLAVALLCVLLIKPPVKVVDNNSTNVIDNVTDRDNTEQTEQKQEEIEQKTYMETNQSLTSSSLEEMNGALSSFSFNGDGFIVDKCVDSFYNETLYYYVTYNDEEGLYFMEFTVLTNPNYTIENVEDGFVLQDTVASYALKYYERSEEEDDMFIFTDRGVITTGKEKIYLDVEIYSFDENNPFVETLNKMIIAK